MFDWIKDLVSEVWDLAAGAYSSLGSGISSAIWDSMMQWLYNSIYDAAADFFSKMGKMGSEMFELSWVKATVELFTYFGWSLFIVGTAVAVFDLAIAYQNGRNSVKTTSINVIKGFLACSLIGTVPVELYKFCISLQNIFSKDLAAIASADKALSLKKQSINVLKSCFDSSSAVNFGLFGILCMIAFAYCIIKVFFANIKRGGILLIQIAVGSLYMFSVPRGFQDGFNSWIKQVIAICLTAFMQTTLLYLGLLTFPDEMLLGLGIMLAANEVPKIANQFGLDSSVKVNVTNVMHTARTAVSLAKAVV